MGLIFDRSKASSSSSSSSSSLSQAPALSLTSSFSILKYPLAAPALSAISGFEVMAVVGVVAAIVSAYRDGGELVREIKERGPARKALRAQQALDRPIQDLQYSLGRGQDVVRTQYERDFRRLGQPFAAGDQQARDTLRDVLVELQRQVIASLKLAWEHDCLVDFLSLQDASDESQDRAIMCLMQLHQRLLVAGPICEIMNGNPYHRKAPPRGLGLLESPATTHPPSALPSSVTSGPQVANDTAVDTGRKKTSLFAPRRSRAPVDLQPYALDTSQPRIEFLPSPPIERGSPEMAPVEFYHAESPQEKRTEDPTLSISSGAFRQHTTSIASSVSAASSLDAEHPEYNPWVLSRTVSPVSPVSPVPRPERDSQLEFIDEAEDGSAALPALLSDGPGSPRQAPFDATVYPRRVSSRRIVSNPLPNPLPPPTAMNKHNSECSKPSWERSFPPAGRTTGARTKEPSTPTFSIFPPLRPPPTRSLPQLPEAPPIPRQNPARRLTPPSSLLERPPSGTVALKPYRASQASHSSSSNASQRGRPLSVPHTVIPPCSASGSAKSNLPGEGNNYAGLCKGAWRLQIGDRKKAIEERVRPGGLTSKHLYWKCTKCAFEGRKAASASSKTCIDSRVYGASGILYRWEFLFKSHVAAKAGAPNPLDANFACVFCAVERRGTPVFGGVAALLAHLQEHRGGGGGDLGVPEGEVLYRMNAVVGRSPGVEEDFDVALPALML